MRAGNVGKGFIAGVHGFAALPRCRVAWEAGRDDDLPSLLDGDRVDVLHVCTPNDVHARQSLAAIERGVHVVCEKPLAISSEECAELVAAAEERGIVHAVCYHVRGYPLVEHMRSEVAAEALGELTFVHGRYLCDDVLFPASGWRDPVRSGPSYVVGDLGRTGSTSRNTSRDSTSQMCWPLSLVRGGPLEDYAALLLRFDGGASAPSFSQQARQDGRTSCSSSSRGGRPVSPGTRRRRPKRSSARSTAPSERS